MEGENGISCRVGSDWWVCDEKTLSKWIQSLFFFYACVYLSIVLVSSIRQRAEVDTVS